MGKKSDVQNINKVDIYMEALEGLLEKSSTTVNTKFRPQMNKKIYGQSHERLDWSTRTKNIKSNIVDAFKNKLDQRWYGKV